MYKSVWKNYKASKRIVSNLFSKYFLEYNDIFISAKLLKFDDAYKLKVAIYKFRMTKSGELPSLKHSLNPTYPSHTYGSRHRGSLISSHTVSESRKYSDEFQVPVLQGLERYTWKY